jgi:hypothetical protein
MLNINLNENVCPELVSLITEFRRSQVSRFPIFVDAHPEAKNVIRFVDSRFPKDSWNYKVLIARLEVSDFDESKKPIYKLSSRSIVNDKYKFNNVNYNAKKTNDPKKLLKLLKDFVKPFSTHEIANESVVSFERMYVNWQDVPSAEFGTFAGRIGRDDIAKEVIALAQQGVRFNTEKFQKLAAEGLEHYQEANRRQLIPSCKTHVYIQPDESVVATTMRNSAGLEEKCVTYESLQAAPVPIQQAVAMLLIVDSNTFVPEVGLKINSKQFWVEVNPNELKS